MAQTLKFPSPIENRFQLRRVIGQGSFGVVYEAFDQYRNRTVALKTLARADAQAVARFKREFRSLAELRHPSLASMYELLVIGDEWALSMELVRGTDLLEHLSFAELQSAFLDPAANEPFDPDARISFRRRPAKEGKLSPQYLEHVREAFRQLAAAIAFLHANGVVHRDIKPSNVMITPGGRVVLLDFGLAIDPHGDATLDAGLILGTPGYMSPEQIAMSKPAPASDWYSFGVMLYQALTGRMPFAAQNGAHMIEQQLRGVATPAAALLPGLPFDLASLADRCLERDGARRPPTAEILETLGSSLVDARGDVRARERASELIGRGRELRSLSHQVKAMAAGGSGLVLLHGSPGVGKTVVLDRLLDDLRSNTGALILGGRCHGWESLPFNAIDAVVDSIARLMRSDPSPAAEALMARSVAMTRLFPTLAFSSAAAADDETIMLPATPAHAIARASAELHDVIVAIARDRPVVLFVDDAQWGDYQSAEVFSRLLTGRSNVPIVLVVCYRTEDWRTSLLLQALANAVVPRVELELQPLTVPMLERIVKRELPDATKAFRRVAAQEVAGNPGLLDIIVRAHDQAVLADAVAHCLASLSGSALRVFELLADAERPMTDEEIEQALELFETDEPLRALTRARLIRLRRTGDLLELDLYHPRLRER